MIDTPIGSSAATRGSNTKVAWMPRATGAAQRDAKRNWLGSIWIVPKPIVNSLDGGETRFGPSGVESRVVDAVGPVGVGAIVHSRTAAEFASRALVDVCVQETSPTLSDTSAA